MRFYFILGVSAKNVTLLVFDKERKKRKEDNLVYAYFMLIYVNIFKKILKRFFIIYDNFMLTFCQKHKNNF